MKRVLRDVTTIIIAHRLESVMDADKIVSVHSQPFIIHSGPTHRTILDGVR